MRRVISELEQQPERKVTRAALEERLGARSDNLLRAIRRLNERGRVGFNDAADKGDATVTLPAKANIDEDEILKLLFEQGRPG